MMSNRARVSNVVGACVAALIYFIVDVSTGSAGGSALLHAVVFGAVLLLIYFSVSMTVVTLKRRRH
jgi:uncharacterized membrane protein YeaQ/YmgE (transglycosylase-associated protein family)